MGEKTFFTVLVESAGSGESFIQAFWAWADHMGAAIGRVLRACGRLGVENATASEADPYDFDTLPGHVVHDEKLGVYFDETRYCFPTEKSFNPRYWALLRDPDGHTLELSYGQEVGLTVESAT